MNVTGRRPSTVALAIALWCAAAVPPLLAIHNVNRYGVDVPAGDQWSIAPMFERFDAGSTGPGGLFEQANESRPAFPRLVFLALSKLDH